MNKSRILFIYTIVSVVIGGLLFFMSLSYVGNFTNIALNLTQTAGEFYGNVDKSLFNITFSIYGDSLEVFNLLPIVAVSVLLLNIIFVVALGDTEKVENESLKYVHQVNIITYLAFVLSFVLFYILIPDKINGPITSYFIFVKMPILSDNIRYVVNLMYVASLFLVVYNLGVFFRSLPESKSEFDEELYAEEFYTHLEEAEDDEEL